MIPKILIGVGVVVLIVAGILGAGTLRFFAIDISDEAIYIVDAPNDAEIEEGRYQLWVRIEAVSRGNLQDVWGDVRIDVYDEQGDALRMIDSDEGGNFGEYVPYGIISVPLDGEYNFVTDSDREIYVTEPMDAQAYIEEIGRGFFLGMPLALAGTALIVAGIVLSLLGRKGKR